ncbi:hypothetical protein ACFWIO_05610 [Streptomyces diastatochromogenes]|uniref:hypothetical protein n=1 Tax=Streptomyces diastatochromogenes TaxID=42236 RepID=UPI00365A6FF7
METRDNARNASDTELTTEDLARTEPEHVSGESPAVYPGEATPEPAQAEEGEQPLIDPADARSYRDRWEQIQGTFVDEPKDAVRSADALVAEVIRSLAETFADHKRELEDQWSRGEEVETEGLRVALRRYRTFFNQLLQV